MKATCRIHDRIISIDGIQFGFMLRKSTTDAIFITRHIQEKHLAKRKELYFAFVDLEKAFVRVPREVVRWALRLPGVEERVVGGYGNDSFQGRQWCG